MELVRQCLWLARTVIRHAPLVTLLNAAAGLIQALTAGVTLLALKGLIDAVAAGGTGLPPAILLLGALLFVGEVAGAVWPVTNNRLINRLKVALQEEVLVKASTLSVPQFDTPATHDLLERGISDHGQRVATVWNRLLQVLMQLVRAGAAIAIVAAVSWWLALLSVMVALPLAWAGARQARRGHEVHRRLTQGRRRSEYFAGMLSDRQNGPEVRAYQLVPFFRSEWLGEFRRQTEDRLRASRLDLTEGLLASFGAAAVYGLVLGGAIALRHQVLTPGGLVALVGAVRLQMEGMNNLAAMVGKIWSELLPLQDLRRLLAMPGEDLPATGGLSFPVGKEIQFESVSFTYPGQTEPALDGLSLTIRPGESLALVGLNGAGKSTLVKLLLGLYAPDQGRITVGGLDLRDIDPRSLRGAVSCVFQDFARFDLSLAENAEAGQVGAGRRVVEEALAKAGLSDLVRRLKHGADTLLGKGFQGGEELSGGEWQRVAIARAVVRQSPVMVLDEPSSALDARAEQALFAQFAELVAGRTALMISHRLGFARLADRIIVLEGGRVVESGSHNALLHQGGRYAAMFRAQASWYETPAEVAL